MIILIIKYNRNLFNILIKVIKIIQIRQKKNFINGKKKIQLKKIKFQRKYKTIHMIKIIMIILLTNNNNKNNNRTIILINNNNNNKFII